MWKKFPESKPTEAGYYYTLYYNTERKEKLYKALWWSKAIDKWVWRIEPEVIAFMPESRNEYYIPCLEWVLKNLKVPYEDSVNN